MGLYMCEHYLHDLDSRIIDELYNKFIRIHESNKSSADRFKELQSILYKLPTYTITEASERKERRRAFRVN